MEIQRLISDYIIQNFLAGSGQNTLDPNAQLLLDEILDSISVFQLAVFMQDHYHIIIPPEDILLENFASVNVIAVYIEKKLLDY